MGNTNAAGKAAEAVVVAEFVKAGFPVLLPFGADRRYDLVVETGGRFLRVQCKNASECRGGTVLRFHARSIRYQSSKRVEQSYRGQADLFAAYAPSTGLVYVLPVDDVPETDVWLRLAPAMHGNRFGTTPAKAHANGNGHGFRWAKDHTLAAWAARLDGRPEV